MDVSIRISINDRPIVGGEISLSHVDKGLYVLDIIFICTIHAPLSQIVIASMTYKLRCLGIR